MITEIVRGKRKEQDRDQIPIITREGILIKDRSRSIFLIVLVGVEPTDHPIGMDLLITTICGIIILILMINGKYPYVIGVKSWAIMLMNVLTLRSPKTMFPYVEIAKPRATLRMSAPNLKRITNLMIGIGRKANTSVFRRMGKAGLGM
jgi:hypothetical protein